MRHYETIAILKPDAPADFISTLSKKVEKVMNNKPGKLIKKDDWGLRRMAYEMSKEKQGRYLFWSYVQIPKALVEVDKRLKFEENILRYMTVVVNKAVESGREAKKQIDKEAKEKKDRRKSDGPDTSFGKKSGNERLDNVDYKDVVALSRYVSDRGKIMPRRVSGIDAISQRAVAVAIKRARQLGLMSFIDSFSSPSSHSSDE